MRIVILSNDDLTSSLIFSSLFRVPGTEIVALVLAASPTRDGRSTLGGAWALRRKMDPRYWLYLVATNGLFRLFERLTAAMRLSSDNGALVSLRAIGREKGIPVHLQTDFNAGRFKTFLAEQQIDLLVIRIGTILDSEVLSLPARGTWCVHSSLLPSFRGIAGEFHALRMPHAPIGSTVFEVALDLDTGAPLGQVQIDRCKCKSVFWHMVANNMAAGELLASMVGDMTRGRDPRRPLLNAGLQPSYFSWPNSEQMMVFRKQHMRLITLREVIRLALAALRLRQFKLPA